MDDLRPVRIRPVLHLCRDRRAASRASRAAPPCTARRPGSATASSWRRCRCGATGWPGPRCWRSAPASAPAICCPSSMRRMPTINTWQLTIADLGFIKEGLTLRINATFIIGAVIMLVVFAIQHRGILRTARIQTILTIATLLPLFIVCVVPAAHGRRRDGELLARSRRSPRTPTADRPGRWDKAGWLLFFGGLFIAAWSAYAFETAVCYMSEFRNPGQDMSRAIIYSGPVLHLRLCPGSRHLPGRARHRSMLDPGIYAGSGMGRGAGQHGDGRRFITKILIVLLFFSAVAVDHDGHGRLVADAASGRPRRLAAEISGPGESAWRADLCHVDGPGLQPRPAARCPTTSSSWRGRTATT